MNIAFAGSNYCGQFSTAPAPHSAVWLPFAPTLGAMFEAVGVSPDWPDVFVVLLAETYPLPVDFEDCQCPTAAVLVDWQQWGDVVLAHAPAFDYVLVDQSGVDAISRYHPEKMVQFTPMGNFSRVQPEGPAPAFRDRPHDVVFVGRHLPQEQTQGRNRALKWLVQLANKVDVRIMSAVSHEEYRDSLCDTKIVLNHAAWPVQGSLNARNFEAPACGALLMDESYNAAARTFFADGEVLFYDEESLKERIDWALAHPDEAQEMIDLAYRKTTAPMMDRFLPELERVVSADKGPRGRRTEYDRIVGLCSGFGNWGAGARRDPSALWLVLELVRRDAHPFRGDAIWLNLAGVAVAELVGELERGGDPETAQQIRQRPVLSPQSLWMRSARADKAFAAPLYNRGRWSIGQGNADQGRALIAQARVLLAEHCGEAVRTPTLLYPVWTQEVVNLDRTLTFHLSGTPFEFDDDSEMRERQSRLLLWRVEELLGDLAYGAGRHAVAVEHYRAAAAASPGLATESWRKTFVIAEETADPDLMVHACEQIAGLNPLDIEYRQRLDDLYTSHRGGADPALRAELDLLRRALHEPKPAQHAPIQWL